VNQQRRDVRKIGSLEPKAARFLGVAPAFRAVWIHDDVVRHIIERRGPDAPFVLVNLCLVFSHPDFAGIEQDSRRFLLARIGAAERALCVAVKLVTTAGGASGVLWVSSAFPLAGRSLHRMLRRHRLIPRDKW
jgi:hypothetical protein